MINHWSDRVTGLELAAVGRAEELLRFLVDLGDVAVVVSMMRWAWCRGSKPAVGGTRCGGRSWPAPGDDDDAEVARPQEWSRSQRLQPPRGACRPGGQLSAQPAFRVLVHRQQVGI
jgi:hypothetical protein